MLKIVAELSRFSQFLNLRPQIDELLHRLFTDFLLNLKPKSIALATLAAPGQFKISHQVGQDGEIESFPAASSKTIDITSITSNPMDQLINEGLVQDSRNKKLLLSGISNGKVLTGLLATSCQSAPSEDQRSNVSPILLLSSFYLFPKITENQFHSPFTQGANHQLTPRQRQVLAGFVDGKTNHELSIELGFSISTIRHETMAIFKALGVSDRKEAAKLAQQNGLN